MIDYYYSKMTDGTGRILVNSQHIFDTLEEAVDLFPQLEKYIKSKQLKREVENDI